MKQLLVLSFAALLVAATSVRAVQLAWAEDLSAPDDAIYQFTDVQIIDGDVYVTGYARIGLAGFVWKRSGGVWTDLSIPSVSFVDAIGGTSGSDLWVGGNSGVHHFDGGAWSPVAAGVGGEVKNIAVIDTMNIVAIGTEGTIRQTTDGGSNWNSIPGGLGGDTVGLLANGASDIWIGGRFALQAYMEHWNGSAYDITPGTTTTLNSLVQAIAQNGTNTYACGTDGKAWKLDASGTHFVDIAYLWDGFAAARDVVVNLSGDAWFVGDRAHVIHYDLDTGGYDLQNDVTLNTSTNEYTSIDIYSSDRNLIVVGNGGVWEAEIEPPPLAASTNVVVNGAVAMQFESVLGSNYVLQCSTDLVTWASKNLTIHGLGQQETATDPSGSDAGKSYRILVTD
jgi:hypothetical protein